MHRSPSYALTRAPLLAALLLAAVACGSDRESTDPGMSAEDFDLDRATQLARLGLETYQQLEDFEAGRPFAPSVPFVLVDEYTTRERFTGELFGDSEDLPIAFVAARDDERYVAFRGTQTPAEWISNITYAQLDYPYLEDGGRTHRGFTRVYQTIREELLETLRGEIAAGGVSRVWVTGHSLGGALAAIAAPDLIGELGVEVGVYSYAAPRSGDPDFRERYGEVVPTSWRVLNTRDLVPDLPPRSVLAFEDILPEEVFYAHTKTEYSLTYGAPIDGPFDVDDIENAHDLCRLHNALCDTGDDPESCRAQAVGIAGCGT